MIKNPERLKEILIQKLGQCKTLNSGEIEFFCPFCFHKKKKLKVNTMTGHWHCFVCGVGSLGILDLFKKTKSSNSIIKEVFDLIDNNKVYIKSNIIENNNNNIVLPNEFIPLHKLRLSIEYKNAIQYLNKRHITQEKINRYNIGYCETGKYAYRIILPSYNANGVLNYFTARAYYDNMFEKYKNPGYSKDTFIFELYISWLFPIILVEGMIDAIVIDRNAIPMLGKSVNNTLMLSLIKHNVKEVYLALDADATKDIYKIAKKLISNSVNVRAVILPKNQDPATIGQSEFFNCMNNSILLDKCNLLKFKMKS